MILAALALAASAPQTVLTVDPKHRLIEGVASDGSTIWLSSLIDRQILACTTNCSTLATLPPGLHPFAIGWDSSRRWLWVAADCPPGVPFIKACDRGSVIAYDEKGTIRARPVAPPGSFHPGDLSSADGNVFVSDSQNGAVYEIDANASGMSALVAPGIGKSGQGMIRSPDGQQLIVADYSQGVAAIDLKAGTRTLLPRQDGKPLRGIDGMARCGDTYYGIYNGSSPGRIVTFRRTTEGLHFGNLAAGDISALSDPTQIVFDGKRLLVVTDSGWELAMKGTVRTDGVPILAVPLGEDCNPL